ncbi:hypothetical protein DENSPDRAFT_253064 [Dentipellis sp. KUC8613]|nr:hypothetical protein DENSPDRAFT_253064 [Dentipellis sp. KUC8613]
MVDKTATTRESATPIIQPSLHIVWKQTKDARRTSVGDEQGLCCSGHWRCWLLSRSRRRCRLRLREFIEYLTRRMERLAITPTRGSSQGVAYFDIDRCHLPTANGPLPVDNREWHSRYSLVPRLLHLHHDLLQLVIRVEEFQCLNGDKKRKRRRQVRHSIGQSKRSTRSYRGAFLD